MGAKAFCSSDPVVADGSGAVVVWAVSGYVILVEVTKERVEYGSVKSSLADLVKHDSPSSGSTCLTLGVSGFVSDPVIN